VLRDQACYVLQKKCMRAFCGQRGEDVVDDQPAASGITHSFVERPSLRTVGKENQQHKNHVLGVPGVAEC